MKAMPVAAPCDNAWQQMRALADGTRFCASCQHAVYDFGAMTEGRVRALTMLHARSQTRLCARQVVDTRGELVVAAERRVATTTLRWPLAGGALWLALQANGCASAPIRRDPTATCVAPAPTPSSQTTPPDAPAPAPADADADGVPDDLDRCPSVAGPAATSGCASERQVILGMTSPEVTARFYFDYRSDKVPRRYLALLDDVVKVMTEYPAIERVRVIGHVAANEAPNAELAHALGLRRATTIVAALVSRGVAAERLEADSRGADEPIVPDDSAERRAANRNAELLLVLQKRQ